MHRGSIKDNTGCDQSLKMRVVDGLQWNNWITEHFPQNKNTFLFCPDHWSLALKGVLLWNRERFSGAVERFENWSYWTLSSCKKISSLRTIYNENEQEDDTKTFLAIFLVSCDKNHSFVSEYEQRSTPSRKFVSFITIADVNSLQLIR